MKYFYLSFFILFTFIQAKAQGNERAIILFTNQELCAELILEINKYQANNDTVELAFQKYTKQLEASSFQEIESCWCMDSIMPHLSKNIEKYKSDPRKKYFDNEGFNLIYKYADKVEAIHFENELRSNSSLQTFNDSIAYVLDRVNGKVNKNRNYLLLNVESYFLKNNVTQGYKEYFKSFDDPKYATKTKDLILVTLMFSRLPQIEHQILSRIDKKENTELVSRMIAVLNILGTSKSAIHLIEKYPDHYLTTPIAEKFYRDKKTRCRDKRKLKKFLKSKE